MVEKISVQIGLEGGKEVEQQLAAIGEAGQKSFEQIGAAGDQANEGIAKTGAAADKASESTSNLTLANVALVAAIAKSTAGFTLHGVEIVQAVRHHETLIESLLKLVSGANTATKALALIAPELIVVGAGALAIVGPIASAVTAFEALEKITTKFAASAEKVNNTLQTLAATSGQSFDELQRGEAAFGQIGIKAETFRGTIAKTSETLAGTDVTGLTRGMKDIVELVKQIAAGDKTIKFADWVTAEDKIKGVSIAMKQAADAGKNATQVLLEFLRSADLATSIKVGAAFGLSEADVDRVRRLDGSISDLIQRIQGAPVLIGPEAAANLERMRNATQAVDSAWVRLKQSVTSTDFQSIAASFSATMNEMKASVLNAAAAISERMGQAFRAMVNQATSDIGEIKAALRDLGVTNFFQQMGTDAQNAVTGANQAIAAFVGAVLRGMGASEEAIKRVQDQINGVVPAAEKAGKAVQQGGLIFTQWGTLAQEGANTAKASVEQTLLIFTQWGTVAGTAGEQGKQAGITAASGWDITAAAIQRAIDKFLVWIGLKAPSNAPTGAGAPANARGGLLGGRGTGTSDSNLAWVSRGEHIMPAAVVRRPGVLSFLEALRRSGRIPSFAEGGKVGAIPSFADGGEVGGMMAANINALIASALAFAASLRDVSNELQDELRAEQALFHALAAQLRGAAGGGLLGGRGTGTSDSNLAWVSRGEHIMPARAVAQPGVLAFLEALRQSGGNLGRVLDGMGRFALGGMVPRPAMAFASGGLAGGMSNVTIQFPGLPAIGGLRASSDVVDQLHKAAALAQVRSGGRKPSRYS